MRTATPQICQPYTCCNDKLHMQNWVEAVFQDVLRILRNGISTCNQVLKTEGEKAGLTITTFSLLSCFGLADNLADTKRAAQIHLTATACDDICSMQLS